MWVNSIEINDFRRFSYNKIKLGKYLTCIAGHNGVGKSQLLAILGNCGELKKRMQLPFKEKHLKQIGLK